MNIPRLVAFDKSGKAICAGISAHVAQNIAYTKVMNLFSEHYDFIDYDVRGKTEKQIFWDNAVKA